MPAEPAELRNDVQTYFDNTFFANGVKAITGPQLNTGLSKAIGSAFFKLDEPRAVSQDIAYVSPFGNDGTAVVGDASQPFATFLAAFNAMPSSNFIIQALGGVYTEDFDVNPLDNKSNFILRLDGSTINCVGLGVRLRACTNAVVYLGGGTINGDLNLGADDAQSVNVFDGNINGRLNLGEESAVGFCKITNPSGVAVSTEITASVNRPFMTNCRIVSNTDIAINGVVNCSVCYIESLTITAIQTPITATSTFLPKFTNCTIRGTGSGGAVVFGTSANLNAIFDGCYIQATGALGRCVWVGNTASNNVFFDNCNFVAKGDVVYIQTSTLQRAANIRTTFEQCTFYTEDTGGSSKIFNEQGAYSGDSGKTLLTGTTKYNKAFTPTDAARWDIQGSVLTIPDAQIRPQ